ncbi:MAG: cyclic nucleotide-binding domain-containing protein, partial [Lachnospiraceae bacterium]|nr:cyclic nucleotide-binding domain-containing protein [Lachnospiraceae bacterium]
MSDAKIMKFQEGSVILREGETCGVMYKILKGHAEIYLEYGTEKETIVGIIGEQKCFGEFGLLLKKPEIYTVVAYSDLLVMKFTEKNVGEFIKDNRKNVLDMMTNMANTIMIMRLQMDLMQDELEEKQSSIKAQKDMEHNRYNAKYIMRQYALQQAFQTK